jgi:hypothetical protein
VDNLFLTAVMLSLFFAVLVKLSRDNIKTILAWGCGAGLLASLVYAVLKRNTGIAVREYYDLGIIIPSVVLAFAVIAIIWKLRKFAAKNSRS